MTHLDMTPTWPNQLREARKLPTAELRRHASVSTENRHRCKDCFCCAALTVIEERREGETEIGKGNPMNPDTAFLMNILLEPAQALRRELGCSFDLVCVPEAAAAAELLTDIAERRNSNISINRSKVAISWFDPRVSDWVCSLHDRAVCDFCGVGR